jgi:hypothetical protein
MLVHTAFPRDLLTALPATRSATTERGLRELETLVMFFTVHASTFGSMIQPNPDRRHYERLLLDGSVELWLVAWATGQGTRRHDNGGALGALGVLQGAAFSASTEAYVPAARSHPRSPRPSRSRHPGPSLPRPARGAEPDHPNRGMLIRPGRDLMVRIGQEE